jgi:AraC family transcriptional regulator
MSFILAAGVFYGDRRRTEQLPGIRLSENAYTPSFAIPRHAHESPFFGMVLEGGYREHYGARYRERTPDTLVFHPAGEVHSERHYDAVVRIFNVEPTPQMLVRLRQYTRVLDGPRVFQAGPLVRLAARLYAEFTATDPVACLAMEALALELLASACCQSEATERTPPAWLRKASDLLHDRCAESLGLEYIAREVGVHPAHLARTFRQHFRCTAGDYQRRARIERARQLLAVSGDPLVDIALALGYADQSHFTLAFKRQTGATPGAFRKASRAKAAQRASLIQDTKLSRSKNVLRPPAPGRANS